MNRDNAGLVLGLICVGGAACFLLVRQTVVSARIGGMLLAGVLMVAGLIGMFAIGDRRRD